MSESHFSPEEATSEVPQATEQLTQEVTPVEPQSGATETSTSNKAKYDQLVDDLINKARLQQEKRKTDVALVGDVDKRVDQLEQVSQRIFHKSLVELSQEEKDILKRRVVMAAEAKSRNDKQAEDQDPNSLNKDRLQQIAQAIESA